MQFDRESALEHHIRGLIENHVTREHPHVYALKNKKAVDILICRDGAKPALFFIEVKYHQLSHWRMGFGGGVGVGFQPEIVKREPAYFESNLRWILTSDSYVEKGVLFVPSSVIRRYLMGGEVSEKYNNIQTRIFEEEKFLTDGELVGKMREWFGLTSKKPGK
jgi:hypothetical protein